METTTLNKLLTEWYGEVGTPVRDAYDKWMDAELFAEEHRKYKFFQNYISKRMEQKHVKGTRVYKKLKERIKYIKYFQDKYVYIEEPDPEEYARIRKEELEDILTEKE